KVWAYRFSSFLFQKFCQIIVGSRKEFYQDFSYDSNSWLFLVCNRQRIELPDHLPADTVKLSKRGVSSRKEGFASLFPFFVQGIGRTLYLLIGTHAVDTLHQDISEYSSVGKTDCQFWRNLKAGIFFQTA